jgi:hypothetical protein
VSTLGVWVQTCDPVTDLPDRPPSGAALLERMPVSVIVTDERVGHR